MVVVVGISFNLIIIRVNHTASSGPSPCDIDSSHPGTLTANLVRYSVPPPVIRCQTEILVCQDMDEKSEGEGSKQESDCTEIVEVDRSKAV